MSMIVFYVVFSMSFYAGTRYEAIKGTPVVEQRAIGLGK